MGYKSLLNNTCNIRRLSGYTDYDFSSSDEGEVTEDWQLVSTGTKCRLDRFYTATSRRNDGMVELGQGTLFVLSNADIRDGDRVEVGSEIYSVIDVQDIYGKKDLHHKEVMVQIIDWT